MILGPGPDWDVNRSLPHHWNRQERDRWAASAFTDLFRPQDAPRLEFVVAALLWVGGATLVLLTWGRPILNILWSLT